MFAAAAGPVVFVWTYGAGTLLRAVVLGAAVALVLAVIARVRDLGTSPLVLHGSLGGFAALAGLVGLLVSGESIAVWTTVNVVLSAWGVLGVPPVRWFREPDERARHALVAIGVASLWIFRPVVENLIPALVLAAASLLAILLAAYRVPVLGRALALVERGFAVLARALLNVAMLAVAVFAVVIPWAAQRVMRWDPTALGGRRQGGWVTRRPVAHDERRSWSVASLRGRPSGLRHIHRAGVSVTTFALCLLPLGAAMLFAVGEEHPQVDTDTQPANEFAHGSSQPMRVLQSQPWWGELNDETNDAEAHVYISHYVGAEYRDFEGTYVNISDGRRVTWQPEVELCRPVVHVWMFGGSTVWGIGQRDGHTVPSELAKFASTMGIPVVVTNWGVPGDVAWQEHRRLERALRSGEPPPDLVVFYDGYNDMRTVWGLSGSGRPTAGDSVGPLDTLPTTTGVPLLPEDAADLAAEQYAAADADSRALLARLGIPMVRFNQPTLGSRAEPVVGEATPSEESIVIATRFRELLPPQVIDVSDLFDSESEPHFVDAVHTDEAGSVVIAMVLFGHLEDQLRAMSSRAEDLKVRSDPACS